jgi:hypothetical protein
MIVVADYEVTMLPRFFGTAEQHRSAQEKFG